MRRFLFAATAVIVVEIFVAPSIGLASTILAYGQDTAYVQYPALQDQRFFNEPVPTGNSGSAAASVHEAGMMGSYGPISLSASATSAAVAHYGVLRASASGAASGDSLGILVGEFSADATARYNDSLTLTSSLYPAGTPVPVTFGFSLHSLGVASNLWAADAFAGLQYYASRTQGSLGGAGSAIGVQFEATHLTVTGYVGKTLTFGVALFAEVAGGTVAGVSNLWSSINASNTSYTSITISDPNVSYAADSGTTYLTSIPDESASVPEPPALSILGFAAAGIAGAKLRRRSVTANKADRPPPRSLKEQDVDAGRAAHSSRTSGQGVFGRKLPFPLPFRDSL